MESIDWIAHYRGVKQRIAMAAEEAQKKIKRESDERSKIAQELIDKRAAANRKKYLDMMRVLMEEQEQQRAKLLAELNSEPKTTTAKQIALDICEEYQLDWDRVRGHERLQFLVKCRQHIMYALREYGLSLKQIGIILGNRDHSTILHGARAHMERNNITSEVR